MNVAVIIVDLILLVFIIVAIVFWIKWSKQLSQCQNNESKYCYSLMCPGPVNPKDQCVGYAQRTTSNGQLLCANGSAKLFSVTCPSGSANCPN